MTTAELPFLDVRRPDFEDDPLVAIREVRAQGPVARSERGLELLTHDLVMAVLRDGRITAPRRPEFIARGASELVAQFIDDGVKSFMQPETHKRSRRIFGQAFRQHRIEDLRPRMRAVAEELVDGFAARGECELVGDFADGLSMVVLCELIGIPVADMAEILPYTQEVELILADPLAPVVPRIEEGIRHLTAYTEQLVAERRRDPRDDVIGILIEAEQTEGKLSSGELTAGIVDLMFAGINTTRIQLSSVVRALIENDVWSSLRDDPARIPGAMEEAMRLYPTIHYVHRIVREEGVELGGVTLAPGDHVVPNMLAASRDPDRFPEPERFVADRGEALYQVGFGFGLHHCLGHAFARATMLAGLEVLTERLQAPAFAGPLHVGPGHGASINGVEEMPLTFTAAGVPAAAA